MLTEVPLMARLASLARAGYYPFPPELLPAVAARLDWGAWPAITSTAPLPFLACDPCAGEGVALLRLLQAGFGPALAGPEPRVILHLHGYELETVRARRARKLWTAALPDPHQVRVTHTDLFRVQIPRDLPLVTPGAHLLWLNAPYDVDPEYGRLEERFLRWTTPLLVPGVGIVCFIVPGYALAASAETLAREYEQIVVYRLPDPSYSVYHQVVLLGLRRVRSLTYPAQIAQEAARLRALAAADQTLPKLEAGTRNAEPLPPDLTLRWAPGGLPELRVVPCDLERLRPHLHLWMTGTIPLPVAETAPPGTDSDFRVPRSDFGTPYAPVGANLTLADFCQGTHVTAMPPLPTHTAQILASGMVNGQLVQPDDPAAGLPPVVLTGHFHRVADAVDTHINPEGEVTSIKYEEKPKLRIDVLALSTPPAFHTLKEGTKPTGTTDLAAMNVADFLAHYGQGLAAVIQAQFPALHDPANPAHHLPLPALHRPLFDAQLHAVCALLKIAAIRGENPHLYGEPGVGKTAQFLQIALALSAPFVGPIRAAIAGQAGHPVRLPTVRNVLVACPPHLLDNWAREIGQVLPGAQVRQITSIRDLHSPPPVRLSTHPLGQGLCFDILSREAAKLGHGWAPARPGLDLGPGAGGTIHRARTGYAEVGSRSAERGSSFVPRSAFRVPPLAQVRAALFAAARHNPALGSYDKLTQYLRAATGNLALRVGSANLGELQQALAGLPPAPAGLRCARCGTVIDEDAEKLAASRGRCPHQFSLPATPLGELVRDLALALAPFAPAHELLRTFHPLPYLLETANPCPLAAWAALTRSTPTVAGLITRVLFGTRPNAEAGTRNADVVEELLAAFRLPRCDFSTATPGSDVWYNLLIAYRRALTELHHQLLGQPQAVRDAVLVPTLTAVRDQLQQPPLDPTGRALLAPFVRRLVQLWTPGAERMTLAGELAALLDDQPPADAPVVPPAGPPGLLAILTEVYRTRSGSHTAELQTLLGGVVALAGSLPPAERAAVIPRLVVALYPLTASSRRAYGPGHQVRYACGLLLALLPAAAPRQELIGQLRPSIALEGPAEQHPWERLDRTLESLSNAERGARNAESPQSGPTAAFRAPTLAFPEIALDPDTGDLLLAKCVVGSPAAAILAVEQLLKVAPFTLGPVCNEPLVQAVPQPGYRVALSRYILRHKALRHRYQLLALDEAHEANHAERAQSQAYYRLAMLPGVLTIPLTGTPMNGYASSLFDLWWHLNRHFRAQFGRKERSRFVALYGYRKLLQRLEDGKPPKERPRLRGKQSDAIVAGDVVEVIGEAPGIAPTALLFTLPDSVPLHLAHLEAVLPPREQHQPAVDVDAVADPQGAAMLQRYTAEMRRLVDTITASLRNKDLAGKLWGFLAQVGLGYPVLCPADVGNSLDAQGRPQYQFLYPASCGPYAGQVFIALPLIPANMRLPHETALLQLVREELQEGRNVLIYLAHTGNPRLAGRLLRLLRVVSPAVYLDVQKVSATRRDAWITERVLKPGVRVLLTNPEAVKTGLNNLTPHFKTAVWFEPTQRTDTYRQAGARIRRIGSHPTDPIRDYLIAYAGTAQEAAVKLILEKVRVSELFDGFDLDAGLAAAGVQDGEMALGLGNATTSIGRALYEHLKEHSGLLRAAAFTNAVRLDITSVPDEPAPTQPARPVIIPIRKGDATQLPLF
jgi:hypothetical protein